MYLLKVIRSDIPHHPGCLKPGCLEHALSCRWVYLSIFLRLFPSLADKILTIYGFSHFPFKVTIHIANAFKYNAPSPGSLTQEFTEI